MRPLTANVLGTWFGCGLAPKAPGTVGALGAIPLHLLLRTTPIGVHLLGVAALSAVGIWAAQRVADDTGEHDPQQVVIDEVAGALIAMGLVRHLGTGRQIAAMICFRLLDIIKPGPIRRAERAEPAGLGIMLDDLLAGLAAGALVRAWP